MTGHLQMIAFIIGTGRCGTSMLAQMLNSHSMICVPFELQILFEYHDNGARLYEVFKEKKNEDFGAQDFIDLIESRTPHNFHEYFDYPSFFKKQEYPIRSLKELANGLFAEIVASKGKKIFIEQTPWYGQRIDILNDLFPEAKYIHMVRDGRDVAISFARTPWWHENIGQNLERWHTEVNKILDSSAQILNPNHVLQVRYEDFVVKPKRWLRRICSLLGVGLEDAMLDPKSYVNYQLYYRSSIERMSSSAPNDWSKSKPSPTFKESCYAWKNYSGYDSSTMPRHITRTLNALGYGSRISRFWDWMTAFLPSKEDALII